MRANQEFGVLLVVLSLGIVLVNSDFLYPTSRFQNLTFRRNEILDTEDRIRLGFKPNFNSDEVVVNKILMDLKAKEVYQGLENASYVLASQHFFHVKPLIEQSKVFQFLQRMPKGAMLHGHNTAMVSSKWFIQNITYRPDLMMYTTDRNVVRFTFRRPEGNHRDLNYVQELRRRASDVPSFDNYLESQINLKTSRPEVDYPNVDVVWERFQNMFDTVKDALRYYPVFVDYHTQLLQELYDDKVMYCEMRTGFGELYDSSGRVYSILDTVRVLKDIVDHFKIRNPNFYGLKFIFSTSRNRSPEQLSEDVRTYKEIVSVFPDFVIGFDIVGQEKQHNSNAKFLNQLQDLPQGTRFFFHSGETDWYGTPMDNNMVDALLMNTTRLGHAFGLLKHPVLWETVKRRRIGIEISPISNQVLNLVGDLKDHPATFYMAENIPIVICCDDPGFWDAKGLSYDFYYAFMGFTPVSAGLETLKKLVWTSIEQSVLTDAEWIEAQKMIQWQWNEFLADVIKSTH